MPTHKSTSIGRRSPFRNSNTFRIVEGRHVISTGTDPPTSSVVAKPAVRHPRCCMHHPLHCWQTPTDREQARQSRSPTTSAHRAFLASLRCHSDVRLETTRDGGPSSWQHVAADETVRIGWCVATIGLHAVLRTQPDTRQRGSSLDGDPKCAIQRRNQQPKTDEVN